MVYSARRENHLRCTSGIGFGAPSVQLIGNDRQRYMRTRLYEFQTPKHINISKHFVYDLYGFLAMAFDDRRGIPCRYGFTTCLKYRFVTSSFRGGRNKPADNYKPRFTGTGKGAWSRRIWISFDGCMDRPCW